MKKILFGLLCATSISAFADCDVVVLKSASKPFDSGVRLENMGGYALAPLCSDLPEDVRTTYYGKFCNSDISALDHTIYAPLSTSQCSNLKNSPWLLKDGKNKMAVTISDKNIKDDQTIILQYPQDFNAK